jgi:hypothetical protein
VPFADDPIDWHLLTRSDNEDIASQYLFDGDIHLLIRTHKVIREERGKKKGEVFPWGASWA